MGIPLNVLKVLVKYPDPNITLADLLDHTRTPEDRQALFSFALHTSDQKEDL